MTVKNRTNKPTDTEKKAGTQDPVEVIGERMLREVAAILAKPAEADSRIQAV